MADEPPRRQVLADSAYGSGPTRAALRRRRHRLAIKPWPTADTGRFSRDDFHVDHDARTVTCPAGHTVTLTAANNAVFERHCHGCPLRDRCTTARNGRILSLTATTPNSSKPAAPGVTATSPTTTDAGGRWSNAPSPGSSDPAAASPTAALARNRIWLAHRAAAINLQRLLNLGLTHHGRWRLAT